MSVAALILGIISLVIGCFGFLAGPLAIASLIMGIVLAAVSIHNGKKATGGLVCSIIGTVFSFIPGIIWAMALIAAAS